MLTIFTVLRRIRPHSPILSCWWVMMKMVKSKGSSGGDGDDVGYGDEEYDIWIKVMWLMNILTMTTIVIMMMAMKAMVRVLWYDTGLIYRLSTPNGLLWLFLGQIVKLCSILFTLRNWSPFWKVFKTELTWTGPALETQRLVLLLNLDIYMESNFKSVESWSSIRWAL